MNEDFIEKDEDGNEITLDDHILTYVMGPRFIKDLYTSKGIDKGKVFTKFFHELKATFVGLIGGLPKKNRTIGILNLWSSIDLLKKEILSILAQFELEDKKKKSNKKC